MSTDINTFYSDDLFQILLQTSIRLPVSNHAETKTGSKFRHSTITYKIYSTTRCQMADKVEAVGLNPAKFQNGFAVI